jgi:alpha-tubulin suppressor-like RCC1 family protein
LDIIDIKCNYNTSYLITSSELYVCGCNRYGQLGLGDEKDRLEFENMTKGNYSFVNISCGGHHVMAVTSSGELYVWGRNNSGQLGTGFRSNVNTPTKLYLGSVIDVFCGGYHSIIQCSSGYFGCGGNSTGQLLHNTLEELLVPTKIHFQVYKIASALSNSGPVLQSAAQTSTVAPNHLGIYLHARNFPNPLEGAQEQVHFEPVAPDSLNELELADPDVTNEASLGEEGEENDSSDSEDSYVDNSLFQELFHKFKDFHIGKTAHEVTPFKIFCGRNYTMLLAKSGLYSVGENNFGQLGSSIEVIQSHRGGTNKLSEVSIPLFRQDLKI